MVSYGKNSHYMNFNWIHLYPITRNDHNTLMLVYHWLCWSFSYCWGLYFGWEFSVTTSWTSIPSSSLLIHISNKTATFAGKPPRQQFLGLLILNTWKIFSNICCSCCSPWECFVMRYSQVVQFLYVSVIGGIQYLLVIQLYWCDSKS